MRWNTRGLSPNIALINSVIITLFILAFFSLESFWNQRHNYQLAVKRLEEQTYFLRSFLTNTEDKAVIQRTIEDFYKNLRLQEKLAISFRDPFPSHHLSTHVVFVIDHRGEIIASTKPAYIGRKVEEVIQEGGEGIRDILSGQEKSLVEEVHYGPNPMVGITVPIYRWSEGKDQIAGAIHYAEALPSFRQELGKATIKHLAFALSLSLCLTLLINLFLSRSVIKPIKRLVAFMKKIDGKREQGLPHTLPGGEIGELYDSFNRMTTRIDSRIRQLDSLAEIAQQVTRSLEIDHVLKVIVESAVKLAGVHGGSLRLLNTKKNTLDIVASYGISEVFKAQARLRIGEGVSSRVIEEKKPLLVRDLAAKHDIVYQNLLQQEGVVSLFSVPLIYQDRAIGCLNLYGDGKESFSWDQVSILSTLADQAAIAIENARLFQQVRDGREKLQAVFDAITDHLSILSPEYTVLAVNAATAQRYGKFYEEIIGKKCYQVYRDKDSPCPGCPVPETIKTKESAEGETEETAPFNDIIRTYSFPMLDSTGELRGIVAYGRIITAERTMERELEDFAYTVSHDLKAPLRAMAGFAKLLEQDYMDKLDEEGRHYLTRIKDRSLYMLQLIDDLLEHARISRSVNPFERIDLMDVLQEVREKLDFQITEKGAAINLPKDLPWIYGHRDQVVHLFINLMDNALKYTQPGIKPKIELGYFEQRDFYEFYLSDNGIGISPRYHEQVFQIFQRLHRPEDYEGTGIGLTVAKSIVEKHRGKIWVVSQSGEGTTFFFTLPKHSM